jgi:glycosyltransferase involved in cell wall biosynthesis
MVGSRIASSIVIVAPAPRGEQRDPEALLACRPALVQWANALVAAGAGAVDVIQRLPRSLVLRRAGVTYHFIADEPRLPFGGWLWNEHAARAVRTLRPTVLHVDGMIFPLLVRHLRLRLPRHVPILVQDHGGIHGDSPGFGRRGWRALHRLGLSAADGFLFTAGALAAPWRRAGIIHDAQKIHEVLEASTDLADAAPPTSGSDHALPGRPALLWVGRLDANKDPMTVLDAFERALPALPDGVLTMVFGDDALLPEVRRRIASPSPLAGRVHLVGRRARAELAPLYAAADLFVLASHHESCGFALLEALSFGVTPVVTDIPAFRQITGGGAVGTLFPVEDVAALARALEHLGGSGATPRAGVRDHFARALSWSAVGRRAMTIYEATAAAAAARP